MNQDIETTLKQDKREGAMAPLGPIVAMPVVTITSPTEGNPDNYIYMATGIIPESGVLRVPVILLA